MNLCSTLYVKCKHAGKVNNKSILQVCCNFCPETACGNKCRNSHSKCGVYLETEAEAITPGEQVRKPYLQKTVESYNPETGEVIKRYEKIKDGAADVGVSPCTITKALQRGGKAGGVYWRIV